MLQSSKIEITPAGWATFITGALKFLLFDLVWAAATSFTGLSLVATWANLLLMAALFAMPFMAFRCRWAQIVVYFLLDLLLVANLMYSRTYFGMIPAESYLNAGNLSGHTASVLDSLRWLDIFFPLTTIGLCVFYATAGKKAKTKSSRKLYWMGTVALLAVSMCSTYYHGGFKTHYDNLTSYKYHSARPMAFTIPGLVLHDLIASKEKLTPRMQQAVDSYLVSQPTLPAIEGSKTNLVLIICESLESWVVEASAEGKTVMPYLSSLLNDTTTLYLPNVRSQVADSRSMDCQLMVNAGLLPLKSGAFSLIMPSNEFFTLSKAMKQIHGTRNYSTNVDKPTSWNQHIVSRSFGMDTVLNGRDFVLDQKIGVHKSLGDESYVHQLLSRFQRGELWPVGEKAMVQVVTYSGHNPWKLPKQYDNLNLHNSYPKVLGDYMTMAHFTDRSLKPLIEYVKSRPDFDSTMIVIMGDHEGLAEYRKDILASLPAPMKRLRKGLEGQKVPLIIINGPRHGRMSQEIGQIDIYPSLLQMLGLTSYRWHGLGRSFLTSSPLVADQARLDQARQVSDHILRHNLLSSSPK